MKVLLFIMITCTLIGAFLWPYTIESWGVFFGKDIDVKWWQGALLGFCPFIGQTTIPVAVITWIAMMFLN